MKGPRALLQRVARFSRRTLTRLAAVLALVALAVLVASILFPKPLIVIFAMSVGQGIGVAAVLLYFLAIVLDVARIGQDGVSEAPDAAPDSSGRVPVPSENPE